MKIKKVLPVVLVVLSIILVATIIITTMFSRPDENVMCEGVSINTIDVGGMTMEEAQSAVDAYITKLQNKEITIQVDNETITTTFGDLGYDCNAGESLEEAFALGKTGNFISRYSETKDLEENGRVIAMDVVIDEAVLRNFLETECAKFDVEPENANISRENGQFIITEHKTGRKVSVDATMEAIEAYMTAEAMDSETEILVEAAVEAVEPEYTKETVSLCKDVLGTFSTSYASSGTSRSGNVSNGARLINGSVVWPGETFSAGGAMNPITADNGYFMASAYENGQVVDSIGGGVCQVSTTLYNAALMAELEIVERSNHSMIVSYVEPSMDSAIAGTYKDLKIKNNTDAPIYIEGTTAGKRITFTIYGHETRPENRTVKYESEVIQVIEPGKEKVTEDPTKPTDYRKVTQSSHKGYKARLWKYVYEDGVEVSREEVNYSSYAATPTYVTIGTMKPEEEEQDAEQGNGDGSEAGETPEKGENNSSEATKPEETTKPEKTDKPEGTTNTEKPDKPEETTGSETVTEPEGTTGSETVTESEETTGSETEAEPEESTDTESETGEVG